MKITLNNLSRYEVAGIKDCGKNGKIGIAGYKCKFVGWLAKIFCKAVAVKTDNGTVYLNKKSFTHWYSRVKPHHDEKKVEKSSGNSKFVEKTIRSLLHLQKPVVKKEPTVQKPLVHMVNTPINIEPKNDIKTQIEQCLPFSGVISENEKAKDKSEILPNLFLGTSDQKDFFDHVVFAFSFSNRDAFKFDTQYFLMGEDPLRFNDQTNLQEALCSIKSALKNGKRVLICDREGKHRSACIAAAYLMWTYGVTADQAANFIKSKRPIVDLDTPAKEEVRPTSYTDFLKKELLSFS